MKQSKLTASGVKAALRKHAHPNRAKRSASFFKTKPGQYGHGDIFIGVTMPDARVVAKNFRGLTAPEIKRLLHSKIHEERMVALLIVVDQYKHASPRGQAEWFNLMWQEKKWINNWDLVDVTVPRVIGDYFYSHSRRPLYILARSKNIWDRRIAIIATATFIGKKDFDDTLKIAKILLKDTHDLIHKATGWMLREVGKRSRPTLEKFLERHAKIMPRTMLRYAIEHFPPRRRRQFLTFNR